MSICADCLNEAVATLRNRNNDTTKTDRKEAAKILKSNILGSATLFGYKWQSNYSIEVCKVKGCKQEFKLFLMEKLNYV